MTRSSLPPAGWWELAWQSGTLRATQNQAFDSRDTITASIGTIFYASFASIFLVLARPFVPAIHLADLIHIFQRTKPA
jgi:hypothetical protein